jgi:hypothetical protein
MYSEPVLKIATGPYTSSEQRKQATLQRIKRDSEGSFLSVRMSTTSSNEHTLQNPYLVSRPSALLNGDVYQLSLLAGQNNNAKPRSSSNASGSQATEFESSSSSSSTSRSVPPPSSLHQNMTPLGSSLSIPTPIELPQLSVLHTPSSLEQQQTYFAPKLPPKDYDEDPDQIKASILNNNPELGSQQQHRTIPRGWNAAKSAFTVIRKSSPAPVAMASIPRAAEHLDPTLQQRQQQTQQSNMPPNRMNSMRVDITDRSPVVVTMADSGKQSSGFSIGTYLSSEYGSAASNLNPAGPPVGGSFVTFDPMYQPTKEIAKPPLRWHEAHPEPVTPKIGPQILGADYEFCISGNGVQCAEGDNFALPAPTRDWQAELEPPMLSLPPSQNQLAPLQAPGTLPPQHPDYPLFGSSATDPVTRRQRDNLESPSSKFAGFYDLYEKGLNVVVIPGSGGANPVFSVAQDETVNPLQTVIGVDGLPVPVVESSETLASPDNTIPSDPRSSRAGIEGWTSFSKTKSARRSQNYSGRSYNINHLKTPIYKTKLFFISLSLILIQGTQSLLSLTALSDFRAITLPTPGAETPDDPFLTSNNKINPTRQQIDMTISGAGVAIATAHALLICAMTRSRTGRPHAGCVKAGSVVGFGMAIVCFAGATAVLAGASDRRDLRGFACGFSGSNQQQQGQQSTEYSGWDASASAEFSIICVKTTLTVGFGYFSMVVWLVSAIVGWLSRSPGAAEK